MCGRCPVGAWSSGAMTTKRVWLGLRSWMPAASTSAPYSSPARRLAMAAASLRDITSSTAAAVESAASISAFGKQRSMKPRHWATAIGIERITLMSAAPTPGFARRYISIVRTISLRMKIGFGVWISRSSVSGTAPSRLFSIGRTPWSARPDCTARPIPPIVGMGTSSNVPPSAWL